MKYVLGLTLACSALLGLPVSVQAAPRTFHCHIDGIGELERQEFAQAEVTIDTDAMVASGKVNIIGTAFNQAPVTRSVRPAFNDYQYDWNVGYTMTEEMTWHTGRRAGPHTLHMQMLIGRYTLIFIDDPEDPMGLDRGYNLACQ